MGEDIVRPLWKRRDKVLLKEIKSNYQIMFNSPTHWKHWGERALNC